MKKLLAALVLLGGMTGPESVQAMPPVGLDMGNSRMGEFRQTKPPIGYVQFCNAFPDDCGPFSAGPGRIELTTERWRELLTVNDTVNQDVLPATDVEAYGVTEFWTYPGERGDCEDYVLLKRKILMDRGWPASTLLITVVRDELGDGHAVLTAMTSAGDLILDNQEAEIRFWYETPYAFLKRQSNAEPNQWVSLREYRDRPDVPVAGLEQK